MKNALKAVLVKMSHGMPSTDGGSCEETCVETSEKEAEEAAAESKDFWGSAGSWFGDVMKNSTNNISEYSGVVEVLNQFLNMINVVGTTIIVIVTIVLGIKFLIGGVTEKVNAKEGLVTLLVACVFFFGWTSIKWLLFPNNNFIFLKSTDATVADPAARILSYVKYFGNIVAFIAIVAIGIRYIFAGAGGKADLKGKSVQFIIGLILTFSTVNFLSFISDVINQALE